MMERSEAPPWAANVARPERSECPKKNCRIEVRPGCQSLDDFIQLIIADRLPARFPATARVLV